MGKMKITKNTAIKTKGKMMNQRPLVAGCISKTIPNTRGSRKTNPMIAITSMFTFERYLIFFSLAVF